MSTTIKSWFDKPLTIRGTTVSCGYGPSVGIATDGVSLCFTRADFLAAVATECNVRIVPADAIVIERGELPEVRVDGKWATVGSETYAFTGATEHRAYAALAEYLDAHPPVDEAQVSKIVGELARNAGRSFDIQARAMYLAGARIDAK